MEMTWKCGGFLRSWRQSETGLWPSPVLLWGVGSQGRPEEWEIQSNIEHGLHWRRNNMEGCPLAVWFRMVEMSSYSKGWEKHIFLFREVTSVKVRCFSTKGFCTFFFPWWDRTTSVYSCGLSSPNFPYVGYLNSWRGDWFVSKSVLLLLLKCPCGAKVLFTLRWCPRYSPGSCGTFGRPGWVFCSPWSNDSVLLSTGSVVEWIWSGQGFFQAFSSAVKLIMLIVFSCSAQA